ncbi:MAG: CpsD/CapB family tyrosine-protein kinase [Syntrophothermus sp.]|uniref:CpsD/CapB family tyrosine-protein kinase n=1 Tax=Syntrophothermus sp. TaxID=2736299 RepID=UPI00257A9188|nr:CpsD/CapB family tyrosine-protein kinase [Syntrophothermus sp.]NSW84417.1 CpsD/CapB family tyrosine-protein kinase [Syntrophothermus sp.]
MSRNDKSKDRGIEMITHWHPKSPLAEAYRTLRTSIHFSASGEPLRTLLITSAGPSEGKSTTLANLAIAMAQAGGKVLVVDADLRKPNQHKIFNVLNGAGLTNHLVEGTSLDGVIQETEVPGLYVLPCGPIPPNPSELLGSRRMEDFLKEVRERFDTVLFDSPPVVAVTDATVLAPRLDGVVLVVRSKVARIDLTREARELLEKTGARLIGVVLNAVRLPAEDYYYYYYGEKRRRK